MRHLLPLLTLGALALAHTARAEDMQYNSGMNYVSVDAQQDDAAQQLSATLSLAPGDYFWIQASGGQIRNDEEAATDSTLGDLRQAGAGFGFSLEHLQLSVNLHQSRNDEQYRQRDFNASLNWLSERFVAGLDVMNRSTDNSLDTVRDFPALGLTNVALHVTEDLRGNGYGLHTRFNLSDEFSLSLGGMLYHYDSTYELTSSTNPQLIRLLLARHPTLSRVAYLGASGVTRSLALLDNSLNVGASYQFSAALLSLNWFHDQLLDDGGNSDTLMIDASLLLGDHWMLSPMVGQSSGDLGDDLTFGGLSVSYNW